jgi:outer membrane protein assembly factor BamA
VVALRFQGLDPVDREVIAPKLLTRGPAWWGLKFWEADPSFDPDDLQEDLSRVEEIHREYGYFEAQARSELEWNDERDEVDVTIAVETGPPVLLVAFDLEAAPGSAIEDARLEAIRAGLPLEIGGVFGSRAYAQQREALLDALAEQGRPSARIEGGARVDLDRHEARIEWTLDPGPFVRFGRIELLGLEDVDPELARRELTVEPGAPYSLSAQRRSERRLRDTELFHAVAIQPRRPSAAGAAADGDPSQPGEVDDGANPSASGGTDADPDAGVPTEEVWPLEVRLRERPPRSVRVSLGYGTEEQGRAHVSWRHRNFLGGARKLEIRAEYSSLLQGGELRFLQPHFIDPETDLGFTASIAREDVPAYEALSDRARIQLTRPITGPWKARTGYEFEYTDVVEVAADQPEEEQSSRVSAVFAGVRRDTLDDRLSPTRGTWLDFYAEPALQAIGSSASYTTLIGEARGFHRQWGVVVGGRLRVGTIEPMGGSDEDDVPIFERFFSGGSTSVRGYDYQSLGPRDDDDDPLGGLTVGEATFELRVPLPWWDLSLVGFLDAGQVSPGPWRLDADDVQYGAGPGVRLGTPVGPLRFDLGFPLNPRDGDSAFRIHFAVGHSF